MEKILVTTDLSENSASAIRFAYKLCLLRGDTMVVLYVDELPTPTGWSSKDIAEYRLERQHLLTNKVDHFITKVCRSAKKPMVQTEIEIKCSTNIVDEILETGETHNCRFICISTNGAGKLKRIIGTHTSKLIAKSILPVLCIPSLYRLREIKNICYASDITNYEKEIKEILKFSMPIGAKITLLHINSPIWEIPTQTIKEKLKENMWKDIKLKVVERNIVNTLHQDIDDAIKNIKPSMAVFFTHQSQSFFDKLFYSSTAQSQSFSSKIPILSFKK